MALIKTGNSVPADQTQPETKAQEPKTQPSQPAAESKAVATRSGSVPVAKSTGSFWYTNEVIDALMADSGYGDFPSIIASQGSFKIAQDKTDVGNILEFRAVTAKKKYVCAPNSNDEEAKEDFAALYEGELTNDGRTIDQCVEDAKAAGYLKADKREYVDLFARVIANSSDKCDLTDEMVILQLSPMSVIKWNQFSKKLLVDAAFGKLKIDGAPIIRAVATPSVNAQKKEYTAYNFLLAPEQTPAEA